MKKSATGTFDVKLSPQVPPQAPPQVPDDTGEGAISRMLLDKQFHGDLEAGSKGQMLALMTAVQGSAGYVAMEYVTGTLDTRKGSFALQHTGTMARGVQELSVTVVPDSGTGELTGLSGRMAIIIEGGKHSYRFDYSL